jgi:hypothetical protein
LWLILITGTLIFNFKLIKLSISIVFYY